MTPEQKIALAMPCLLSIETTNPVYGRRIGAWSEVLTVNTGYE